MAAVQLKDVVTILRSGEWCSIAVVQCDMVKKKAGKLMVLPKVRIARRKSMEEAGTPTTSISENKKSANHNLHFTLNIELPNNQIRKIHPALVYEINGQKVI